ncbi:MAG: beta-lactamase family protein [Cyclobacteriaceae bacterium]|nr:beta-lactamase family protein [Cyclobacteriaceae bacterium]
MKNLVIILNLFFSVHAQGQVDSIKVKTKIVLLKNENQLLPFKQLELLAISYADGNLERFGNRYTGNKGKTQVLITANAESNSQEEIKILLIIGDEIQIEGDQFKKFQSIIYLSDSTLQMYDLLSQILFGGRGFTDTLTTETYGFEAGTGIQTKGELRFSFGAPKEVAVDSAYLNYKIDSIALMAIDSGVAPGIQVLVARNGKVILHKTYGYLTYESKEPVRKELLYDFASITKITGALPALMQLYDQDKFSLDATMGTYLPYFSKGNKKDLQYRQVLSHNARLKAWIPYWTTTIKKSGKYKRNTLSHDSTANYSVKVVDKLYLHKDYRNIIYKQIRKSALREEPGYKYSGLSFYLYPDIIERITKQDYETYLKINVYEPLGASTITYNPLRFYPLNKIVPTEIDTFFRMAPLRGTVHDEGAAMMKGVSSNAGLFGTTLDLAKIMQMYLWMGSYGDEQLISKNTMELFTACHYCNEGNRRGLAFDKPVLKDKKYGSTAIDASPHSFGHSGYTGTFAWADPENGLLFIFMSNRVYPTRDNPKLYQLNIRPAMHQAIYNAIKVYGKMNN